MTLGRAPQQADLKRSTAGFCEGRVAPGSIYGILPRECFTLFPDEMFADLFDDAGRRSVPPMIVAVVMMLQRIESLSDREAAERFAFNVRWKYAAGGLDFDYPGFVHTVLVDMRARCRMATAGRPAARQAPSYATRHAPGSRRPGPAGSNPEPSAARSRPVPVPTSRPFNTSYLAPSARGRPGQIAVARPVRCWAGSRPRRERRHLPGAV